MADFVDELHREGYAIVRGFFAPQDMAALGAEVDRIYADSIARHHATYRHKNLLLEILDDPQARRRGLLPAHRRAWINPLLEERRRDPRYLQVLEPFLGRDIKQI